ncbi:MAG TPA: hypothetical protein VM165_09410 [Planctomycetaceae bacterium]|nr:hypothetical protein [Planctomycetaceae bacterium]
MRLLAEMGEEPAFIARGIAPQTALGSLLCECGARREELLKGPYRHLAILAHRVDGNWSRLAPLLAGPEAVAELEALHAHMPARRAPRSAWLGTEARCLSQFLASAARFNRAWRAYLTGIDYDAANKPRREYNQYYPVEKACAFDQEPANAVFEPLAMIDVEFLERRFPYLSIPQSPGRPG